MNKKAQNNIQIKKDHMKKGVFGILAIAVLYMIFGGGSASGGSGSNSLTGQIVGMDPNRDMAGGPCHVMGGQVMGDCETREINLIAEQWSWSEPTITVKSGELVRIVATSNDVNHGIAIPEVGFNMPIRPGETTSGEFMAPAPGEYQFGCSVTCGTGHHNHVGKLIVLA